MGRSDHPHSSQKSTARHTAVTRQYITAQGPASPLYASGKHGSIRTVPSATSSGSGGLVIKNSSSKSSTNNSSPNLTKTAVFKQHRRSRSRSSTRPQTRDDRDYPKRTRSASRSRHPSSAVQNAMGQSTDNSFVVLQHGDHDETISVASFGRKSSVSSSADRHAQSPHTASTHETLQKHVRRTRKIVQELNRATGHERRIAALSNACEAFDHGDEFFHNAELFHGAAQALSKMLGYSNNDDEIRMILSALEMVFRGTPQSVHDAYDRIGTGLPHHLLRIVSRCESGSIANPVISIQNTWRILLYISRCQQARPGLCRIRGILPAIARASELSDFPDVRMSRIRLIANLANCDSNKVLVYENDDILECILRTAHLDETDQVRHHAAVALSELASASANQRSMAANDKLLGCLVKMILVEKNAGTKDAVIKAVQTLAFAKENRVRLVTFKNGVVLEAMKKSLLNDDKDPRPRIRAAGALTNLACDETSSYIGEQKGMLETLVIAATKDINEDVQKRACLALAKVANGITSRMACFETLLDALVAASLTKVENNISGVFRVKARDPENRESLVRHPGVLDTLCDICLCDTALVADRDNAVRAIMHLVNEDSNRKVMCTRAVLNALVAAAGWKDPDLQDARDSAVRAMERLATDISNRSIMARHPGLLVVVSKAVEREAEWEEEGMKSDYGFLAKPLLMTLLLAM